MFHSDRPDLSDWIIHFVHDRVPEDNPNDLLYQMDSCQAVPDYFDKDGIPHTIHDPMIDDAYPIEEDAYAFSVLCKILHDGYIKSGWSFRHMTPTIYGPYSTVCFTDMPLYALISYSNERMTRDRHHQYVGQYGIAFRRRELFAAGARPVIYGLSAPHREAKEGEHNYYHGLRVLSDSSGLGLNEQYRYVATNLNRKLLDGRLSPIDWTHEREWRWPLIDDRFYVAGLPFFLQDGKTAPFFSEIIVIVSTEEEAQAVLEQLKYMYDARESNFGFEYDINAIKSTRVLSIERLQVIGKDVMDLSLDKLSSSISATIPEITVSPETRERVRVIWEQARDIAYTASEKFFKERMNSMDNLPAGFANIVTYDISEITQAMVELGIAHSSAVSGYNIYGLKKCTVQSIDVHEAGAEAAAQFLTQQLGQKFYMNSRLD